MQDSKVLDKEGDSGNSDKLVDYEYIFKDSTNHDSGQNGSNIKQWEIKSESKFVGQSD